MVRDSDVTSHHAACVLFMLYSCIIGAKFLTVCREKGLLIRKACLWENERLLLQLLSGTTPASPIS